MPGFAFIGVEDVDRYVRWGKLTKGILCAIMDGHRQKAGINLLTIFLSVIENGADQYQFLKMYERHFLRMRSAASRYARGHRYNAEDLMQEMWMRVARQVDRLTFSGEREERVYLHAVLRSCAMDFWRKESRRRQMEAPFEEAEDAPSVSDGDLSELVGRLESEEQMRQIAATLSQADREILSLVLFSGLPVREAATALGIRPGAASKRLNRAKARLAEKIREAGGIHGR